MSTDILWRCFVLTERFVRTNLPTAENNCYSSNFCEICWQWTKPKLTASLENKNVTVKWCWYWMSSLINSITRLELTTWKLAPFNKKSFSNRLTTSVSRDIDMFAWHAVTISHCIYCYVYFAFWGNKLKRTGPEMAEIHWKQPEVFAKKKERRSYKCLCICIERWKHVRHQEINVNIPSPSGHVLPTELHSHNKQCFPRGLNTV